MPARKHASKLMKLADGRIILGLGVSMKSAPLMPLESEIAPIARAKNAASKQTTIVVRNVGW